jgi:hypothetical protein
VTPVSIECESRIERVVVYARGAVVARRITLPEELPDGPIEIAVRGITALAEPGSARVLAEGKREVIGLRAKRDVPKTVSPGAVAKRLRELEIERNELTSERGRLRSRRERLASVTLDPGMAKPWRRVDPQARIADALALSGLLGHELERADARLAGIEEALEKNKRERVAVEIEAMQAKTSEIEGDRPPSLELLVRLGPGGAVQSLEIEYVIGPARWVPTYAARFSAGATRVEWTIEALVAQASGEDWSHVRLALSTADLVRDARLPELASLRLGRAQPPARKGYRAPPEGLDAMFEGFDRFVASLPSPGEPAASERASLLPPMPKQATRQQATTSITVDSLMTVRTPHSSEEEELYEEGHAADELAADERVNRLTLPSADTVVQTALAVPSGGKLAVRSRSAAALPPMAAAPLAPSRAPAGIAEPQEYLARSKGGGIFSRSAPEGAASFGGGGASAANIPAAWDRPEPEAIEPADAWLNFDALILPETTSKGARGRLVREDAVGDDMRRGSAIDRVELLEIPERACDPRDGRGHFDHRYDAESLADVPSDARLHRVSVLAASAPSTARFITVPRESAEVYREVEIQNPFDAPLLAGPVEVFIDGALLTQSSVGHVDRGGSLLLGLGVEDRLRVARNARVDEATAGLLGGSTAVEHAISIELASALGREVEVAVIDRIPIADDKDIDIKTLYVRPAAEAYTQAERGSPVRKGLRWQVTVPPGGKTRIELGYKVVLPSKSEIVGGNRRE